MKGTVRYGNEILQSATITIGEQTKITDNNGEFSFSVKPGTYIIIITHAGYKKIQREIGIECLAGVREKHAGVAEVRVQIFDASGPMRLDWKLDAGAGRPAKPRHQRRVG